MRPSDGNRVEPFLKRLETVITVTDEEKQAIRALPVREANIKADQDVVREGEKPTRMFFIIEGLTCTYKMAADSRRQIVGFHLQGDAPDLQSIHLPLLDVSISTITPCRLGFVEHSVIRELCAKQPGITGALWRNTLIDAAIFREWMTSIGQRSARSRIAHLLCELFVRYRAMDMVHENIVDFPITQLEIGDALGISTVHVNRVIKELRNKHYVVLGGGKLAIIDWHGLQREGDFLPDYLHIKADPEIAVHA